MTNLEKTVRPMYRVSHKMFHLFKNNFIFGFSSTRRTIFDYVLWDTKIFGTPSSTRYALVGTLYINLRFFLALIHALTMLFAAVFATGVSLVPLGPANRAPVHYVANGEGDSRNFEFVLNQAQE